MSEVPLSKEDLNEILTTAYCDFREATFDRIAKQHLLYEDQLKKAERCRIAGKLAILAPLVAAGALMSVSHTEKEYTGFRILTDIAALCVSGLGGVAGAAGRDRRKLEAAAIASETVTIATESGIDAPSWAHSGVRLRADLGRR